MDDAALAARGARRYIADKRPGFPCRVSLCDADPGERVVLLPFTHQAAPNPFHASGPIFVREGARNAVLAANEVPELLRTRLLSVRAYDSQDMMTDAEVVEGRELESYLRRCFDDPLISYVHIHYARRGCYACRVDRAQ